MACGREWDVDADRARAVSHKAQLHFPFVQHCAENELKLPGIFADLYDTPWLDNSREAWFCSNECEKAYCRQGASTISGAKAKSVKFATRIRATAGTSSSASTRT